MGHANRILIVFIFAATVMGCTNDMSRNSYTGYIEADYVYVAAPGNGWIEQQFAVEGARVKTGTILYELDPSVEAAQVGIAQTQLAEAEAMAADLTTGARAVEIEAMAAEVSEAEAALQLAKAEKDRWLVLVKRGVASTAQRDTVEANYAAAEARVKAARRRIDVARLDGRTAQQEAALARINSAQHNLALATRNLTERTVRSKTAGRIEEIYFRAGELAIAGRPLLALLPDERGLKIKFFVPEADLAKIALGTPVRVMPSGGEAFEADISYIASEPEFTPPIIYSTGSRQKLVFLVEAFVPPGAQVRPGLPVDVDLP